MRLFTLLAILFFVSPAVANDYCEGRSPRSRGCSSHQSAPIVCEHVRVRPEGSLTTTTDYVCKIGDRIVSVRKGRDHNWDIGDIEERRGY